jgi:hypothetical protein
LVDFRKGFRGDGVVVVVVVVGWEFAVFEEGCVAAVDAPQTTFRFRKEEFVRWGFGLNQEAASGFVEGV